MSEDISPPDQNQNIIEEIAKEFGVSPDRLSRRVEAISALISESESGTPADPEASIETEFIQGLLEDVRRRREFETRVEREAKLRQLIGRIAVNMMENPNE